VPRKLMLTHKPGAKHRPLRREAGRIIRERRVVGRAQSDAGRIRRQAHILGDRARLQGRRRRAPDRSQSAPDWTVTYTRQILAIALRPGLKAQP
jgi:hypothetical protein